MDRFILYPLFLAAIAAIIFLSLQLFGYANALPTWQAALAQSNNSLRETKNALSQANANIVQANAIIAEQSRKLDSTAAELAIRRNALQAANDQISQANDTIVEQSNQLNVTNARLKATLSERDAARNSLALERENLAAEKLTTLRQRATIAEQSSDLSSKDRRITQLSGEISQQNTQISRLNSQISRQRTQISQQNSTIANLRSSLNQRVLVPTCSTNYYTSISGQLHCVSRRTAPSPTAQGESRAIDLPQTGRVTLKIYRSGELGFGQSMDILEHAVRTIEEYMGQPIPLQNQEIRLDFVKALELDGDFAGVHRGTHMEILQDYESGQSWQRAGLGSIIAHEVAHYYWSGERNWLHEGAADFLELYSENRRIGTPIRAKNRRCSQVSNISQLEGQRYETADAGFRCNYSLGEGLFVDLYNAMSATRFRQSFRELYDSGKNHLAGVHQVRQAYYYSNAWAIIDRWYGYREKPEAHWPNGEFLGYYTWEEGGKWVLTSDGNGRPCATILQRNDQTTRGGFYFQTRDACHYTGTWSPEGDLLVTIRGTIYRAVDVQVRQSPRLSPFSTVIPSRGELWNN